MKLGAFSISLSVKDLQASKDFYEALGFETFAGDMARNYLIMKNGNRLLKYLLVEYQIDNLHFQN